MNQNTLSCRIGCGACCIAPSISSVIPGMPEGKPAGIRCIQLTPDNHCMLFDRPGRPAVCSAYSPTEEFCGFSQHDAMENLRELEMLTRS